METLAGVVTASKSFVAIGNSLSSGVVSVSVAVSTVTIMAIGMATWAWVAVLSTVSIASVEILKAGATSAN